MGADGAVIQLATKCASADEFVERFARFATQTDVVVPAVPNAGVGTAGRFTIRLKDQAVIMSGRCEVSEVTSVAGPPGGPARSLMRLRLLDMDARSRGIHLRLLERGAAAAKAPRAPADRTPPPRPPADFTPPPRPPADFTPPPRPPAESAPPRRITSPALSLVRSPPATARPSATVPPPATARPSATVPPPVTARPSATVPPPATAPAPITLPRGLAPPVAVVSPPIAAQRPSVTAATSAATKLAPKVTATMVGVPMPLAPAPAPAVVAPPSAALEATLIAPATRPEARAPGAAFTLPANPLSDLDGADLASFIELQLHETDGGPSVAGTSVAGEDVVVDEAVRPPAPAAPRPATTLNPIDRRARALSIARRAAPFAACALGGLLLGLVLRSGAKPAPVATPTPAAPVVAAPAPVAPPAPDPAAAAPVLAAPAADVPAPRAPGECVARVTTKPAGATVSWGEIPLGTSPIAHAPVPCGPVTVTVSHDRYQDVTRSITAKPGESAIVTARLARPRATALVTSSPPNALIKLNGRPIGPASGARPRKIALMRYETVRVEASLPGYQRWTKSLYLKEAETKIDVALLPVAKKAPPKDRRR